PRHLPRAEGGEAFDWSGQGESVWDGWFLLTILPRFAALAEGRGDAARVARYREEAARLKEALEKEAWDGGWYGGEGGDAGTRRRGWCRRRRFWGRGTGRGSCSTCSTRCRTPRRRRGWRVTGWSRTWWRRTCTGCRRTWGGAAGPGTRARRPGCTGWPWRRS